MTDRDLAGYAGQLPHPHWPGGARVAVQFVLNVEEGAERTILNGDAESESYLHEIPGRPARPGARDLSVGGRLGYRIELLFGILGAEVTLDGRGYGGEALFGLDARAMIDVGALTEIVVALATNG